MPAEGTVLEGTWELRGPLGVGGMGSVFRARDLALDREVAIKFLSKEGGTEHAQRFEREAKLMARLDHPNLVPVHAFGVHEGSPFLVMKLVEGQELDPRLELPLTRVAEIVGQVCDALGYLHRQGILHRDIKPPNVLVGANGKVTLLDYGVAKALDAPGLTPQGSTVGTPEYMSPEQVLGEPLDARSDLYSLGVLLFELATGTRLHPGKSDAELMIARVEGGPPDPLARSPRVTPALARVIVKALARQPAERFASADAFKEALLDAAYPDDARTLPESTGWDAPTVPHMVPRPATSEPPRPTVVLSPSPEGSRAFRWLVLGALALAALAAILYGVMR